VEEVADAVAAVGADHGEAVDARAAGDGVAEVAEARARLDKRDGVLQAVVRAFDEGLVLGGDLADGEGLVEVAVVAAEEGGDVDVDDVPFGQFPKFLEKEFFERVFFFRVGFFFPQRSRSEKLVLSLSLSSLTLSLSFSP